MSAMDDAREPASTEVVPENSVFAELRRQHAEITGSVDPLYLPIESYTGVVARYRYVPVEETKAATQRQMKIKDVTDGIRIAAVDLIALAIDGLYVVAADGTIPKGKDDRELYELPLKQLGDPDEPPMRYDERLADAMGFGTGLTVNQIIRRFFGDDRTIIDHASDLGTWMSTARRAVTETVAGE